MKMNISLQIALDEKDVHEEMKHTHLNTIGFVRGRSELDQWFLLVSEAWERSKIPSNEFVRDYLVTMLNRFMSRPDIFEKLSFFDYCQHLLGIRQIDLPCVQDVADMSLQYVAFFPERSENRHEPRSIEYSSEIGVGLYRQLARQSVGKDDWFSKAFQSMADSFGQAVMVLRSACPRFTHTKRVKKAFHEQGMGFMSDHEAAEVVRHVERFALMYLETSSTKALQ